MVEKGSDNATLLHEFEKKPFSRPTSFIHHSMSFVETRTERTAGVHRPSLSHTRLDPKVYLEQNYLFKQSGQAVRDVQKIVKRIQEQPNYVKSVTFEDKDPVYFKDKQTPARSEQ